MGLTSTTTTTTTRVWIIGCGVKEIIKHVLFECGGYERFRRDWKGVSHQERESGFESIWGYKRVSERLNEETLSMLSDIWIERELREREREPG